MPVGYTDAHKIGNYIGRALTSDEFAQATWLVDAIEDYINTRTGRSWLAPSPVVNERHIVYGPDIFLDRVPVVAVTSVTVMLSLDPNDDAALDASSYRLEDAARGLLRVSAGYPRLEQGQIDSWAGNGQVVQVTYTHGGPLLPATLELAATMLGAHWLRAPDASGMPSASSGIQSFRLPDLSVTYAMTDSAKADVPDEITNLIDMHSTSKQLFA